MSPTRRILTALAVALGLTAVAPAVAAAHATLEGTVPQRGAVLAHEPSTIAFRFDEPVEGTFGAVRVFDREGRRVDAGDAFHPGGQGSRMGVHLKRGLPHGTYTATYRVVSADGHIVSGGFTFSLGSASAAGATVAKLLRGSDTGPVTSTVFGVARGIQYGALALAAGLLLFMAAVWTGALDAVAGGGERWAAASAAFARRLRAGWLAIALAGLVSAAAAVVLEGASAAGISGFSALSPTIVRETLQTRFGLIWGLAVPAWLLAGAGGAVLLSTRREAAGVLRTASLGATGLALPRRRPGRLAALALPVAFLVLIPALSGHPSTQSPVAVLFPANVLHVAAMSAWLGGLVGLVLIVPAATRQLERDDRSRLLAALLARFSPLALAAVVVLAVSGLVQAYVEVRTPANLIDTGFGRLVLAKMVLLTALIGLGAFQRNRSVPRLRRIAAAGKPPGAAGLHLRRALRAEVALIVAVLGVTAALSGAAPSIAAQSGPFNETTRLGPAQLQLTVDPARVGSNAIHLYLLDPRSGAQYQGAKQVVVDAALPAKQIGPIEQDARVAGPGHYVVTSAVLGVKGTWRMRITMRTSKFDQYTRTVQVPIR